MSSKLPPGAVVLRGAGKRYRRYARPRDRLLEWCTFGRAVRHETHDVLRALDLDVAPGEALGIVGRNGAGKSTLLKLIAGTTQPTTGAVAAGGKVAALLELGLGFHPEFTGRQNAVLAGQLLGAERGEIERRLPWIEEFSELGPVMDHPLRTYSSGMALRLAFATATSIRPDVLIVDEALAVGDAYFQLRCIDRIKELRADGTTLLFVSHDASAVKTVCERAILLDGGVLARSGDPATVLDYYNALIAQRSGMPAIEVAENARGTTRVRSGDGRVNLIDVALMPADRSTGHMESVVSGRAVTVRVRLRASEAMTCPTVGVLIRDRLGNDVYGINTHDRIPDPPHVEAAAEFHAEFSFPCHLGAGRYSLSVAAVSGATHVQANHYWEDHVLAFEVLPASGPLTIGVADLRADVAVHVVEPAS